MLVEEWLCLKFQPGEYFHLTSLKIVIKMYILISGYVFLHFHYFLYLLLNVRLTKYSKLICKA